MTNRITKVRVFNFTLRQSKCNPRHKHTHTHPHIVSPTYTQVLSRLSRGWRKCLAHPMPKCPRCFPSATPTTSVMWTSRTLAAFPSSFKRSSLQPTTHHHSPPFTTGNCREPTTVFKLFKLGPFAGWGAGHFSPSGLWRLWSGREHQRTVHGNDAQHTADHAQSTRMQTTRRQCYGT